MRYIRRTLIIALNGIQRGDENQNILGEGI